MIFMKLKIKPAIIAVIAATLLFGIGWQCGKHSVPAAGVWIGLDPVKRRVVAVQNNSASMVSDFGFQMQWQEDTPALWTITLKTLE